METEEYQNINQSNEEYTRPKRGRVKRLSFGSTRRAKQVLRNIMSNMTHEIALTYPANFPVDGLIVKEHLHKFKLRLHYRDIKMFWFMEFQKRGAAHFHGLINQPIDENELKRIWYEIVGSGDPKHLKHGAHIEVIRTPEGALHYLTGYLTKQEQKIVPEHFRNLGRYWGYSLSLFPKHIKVIFGRPEQIRTFRKELRTIRRWFNSKTRNWKHFKRTRNPYVRYRPGDYLTVFRANIFIEELKRRELSTELWE